MKQVKLSDVTDTSAEHEEKPQAELAAQEAERFGVGTLLSDTFATFFRHWFSFTAVAVLAYMPLYIGLIAFFDFDLVNFQFDPNNMESFIFFMISAMGLSLLAHAFMTAAISYGAIEDQADKKVVMSEMVMVGLRNFLPVLVAMIVATILFMLGGLLLVIPGIIVMLMLVVTTQVIVAEGRGPMEALRRSKELTDGYKWPILGALILVGIITEIATGLIGIPLGLVLSASASSSGAISASVVVSGLLESVSYAVLATCSASIYTNLRRIKEGAPAEEIARVFA